MRLRLRIPTFFNAPKGVWRWVSEALWLFGSAAAIGTVFVLSFFLAMRMSQSATEVEVPDITGMTLEAASREVAEFDLVLQVVDQRNDPTIPSDRILQQAPPAKVAVRRGRKIKLVMSLGGKVLEVPNLSGQAARAVEIELRQQGFASGDEVRVASTASSGIVIAQVPPPETPAVPSSRVHRLVSSGPQPAQWVMPDLTGLHRDQVERWLERKGFRRGAVRQVSISGRQEGRVVGQLPLPGYPIRTNDIVDLTVAR